MDNLDDTKLSEIILRLFYNLPFIGMAITSPETKRWVKFNDRLCEILGYSREELPQITWTEITHPDDLELDLAEFARAMRGETEGYVMDKRFIRKDGSIVYTSIDVKSVRKEDRSIDFFIATVQDISDRKLAEAKQKQVEKALAESEERYRQVVQTQIDFILRSQPDTTIIFANESLCRALGMNLDQVIGLKWIDFAPLDELQRTLHKISTLSPINPSFLGENRDHRADGQIGYTQWINQGIFDERGQLIEIQSAGRDVTALKQSELAIKKLNEELEIRIEQRTADLSESEARNFAIIHALPDLLLLLKPDGTCLDCIMPSTFDQSRYIPIQKHISEVLSPETIDSQLKLYEQAIATGELQIFEHQLTKFGKTVDEEVRIAPYGKDKLLVIVRDITDRKLAEAKILHTANQLANTNRELESFSYSVSHDLRAPLRHMNGFVNALQQRLKKQDALNDPKVTHYLEVIETSSQKMGHLIDGLLTLSRYGRRPLESKQISIRDLVDEAIEIIRTDPSHNPLVEFAIGDLPTTIGDRTLLQQVFRNLIGNAVKFSRNQPQPYIKIDSLPDQTIRIQDNGVGFQMEYADKLFGAFQRLHNDKEFEGTGIGLAIVQRIIQRHGGLIRAEGYPDQGATFFIKL